MTGLRTNVTSVSAQRWPLAAGPDRDDRGQDEEDEEHLADVDDGEAVELRRPEDGGEERRSPACRPRSRP